MSTETFECACCGAESSSSSSSSSSSVGPCSICRTCAAQPTDPLCDCCVPDTMTATFTAVSGCACLNGLSVTLTKTGTCVWEGDDAKPCASCITNNLHVHVYQFTVAKWAIGFFCDGTEEGLIESATESCDPFVLTWNNIDAATLCGGIVNVTVTQ